jgi:ribosomal-protein-alanine N-acetyltransferase
MRGSKLIVAGFQVRAFRADDLNRVMEINLECLPENYSAYFYRDIASSYPDTFLVAESDGEIQGYIMCRVERGFSKVRGFSTARLLHVVSIAVRQPYRRKGIAFALMNEAMKRGVASYKASECYLEVRVGNEAAISLYEKLGFSKVKRNYGYYLDGEDAWVMAFPLK